MARSDTMQEERWRAVGRVAGIIVRDQISDEQTCRKLAFEWATAYENTEVQVRRAGTARYQAVIQHVGSRVIQW